MDNTIKLNIRELYYNCCDNKEVFLNNMLFVRDNYNRRIHNLTSYTPYSIYHFMHNLNFGIDDNMNICVRLCNDDLLDGICSLLEIDSTYLNEDTIIEVINKKLEELKSIKDKSLKNKFPKLYDIFQQGLGMYRKWYSIECLDPSKEEEKDLYERLNKVRKEYFSYGFRYSYDKFTDTQADYIERLIRHKDDIKRYCNKNSHINDIYFNGLNRDKFNLYVFKKYVDKIKECNNDKLRIELLKVLNGYLPSIICIDDNVKILNDIDRSGLVAEYLLLKREYGIPKTLLVDGAILPSSEDETRKGNNSNRSFKPLSDEEREELIEINRKKKNFYKNSGYITVITEKDNLTGNSAFVYPNGHILEDYIADEELDSSLRKNKKNAVYHVDIYGFMDLLDMGKMEVKRDNRCHGTFNHTGDWVSRLEKVVNIESTDEVFEDTKQFIKKISERKKS